MAHQGNRMASTIKKRNTVGQEKRFQKCQFSPQLTKSVSSKMAFLGGIC